MSRLLLSLGGLAGLLGVGLAAAGAHLGLDEPELRSLNSATMMLGWHAPALLAIGILARGSRLAGVGGAALALGLTLFCGALLLRVFAGISSGGVAPVGGVLLMLGWAWLAVVAWRRP